MLNGNFGDRTKCVLSKLVLAFFVCIFTYIGMKGVFGDNLHNTSSFFVPAYALIWLALYGAIWALTKKFGSFFENHYTAIVILFSVICFAALFHVAYWLRFYPIYDMGRIYGGAVQWLNTGSFSDHYEYFGTFPNNLGAMGLLRIVFGLSSKLGNKDYLTAGTLFNIVLIEATFVFTVLTARKMFDKLAGIRVMFIFLTFIPFYFMGTVFYTDSLSLLFPILTYYLYLNFKESEKWYWKVLFAVLAALVLAIGFTIKATVAIVLIAIVIDGILSGRIKDTIIMTMVAILILAAYSTAFNSYFYHNHLSEEKYQNLSTPIWHWLMMGLNENGSYSDEDYMYTRSFALEERGAACRAVIKTRVEELGMGGLAKLWSDKITVCFLDGTCALSDFLDDYPQYDTWLHKYILYNGESYGDYQTLANGALIALYFIMVANGVLLLHKKGKSLLDNLYMVPMLSAIGIVMFLVHWETSGRYYTNFIPLFFICGIVGLSRKRRRDEIG